MDAAPAHAALGTGNDVVLEAQDGEVDVAVGQVVARRPIAVELAHLGETEVLDVEVRSRFLVLGLNRNMPDLCHGRLRG